MNTTSLSLSNDQKRSVNIGKGALFGQNMGKYQEGAERGRNTILLGAEEGCFPSLWALVVQLERHWGQKYEISQKQRNFCYIVILEVSSWKCTRKTFPKNMT